MALLNRRSQSAELAHLQELQSRFPAGTPVTSERVERTIESIQLPDGRSAQRITETIITGSAVVPPQLQQPALADDGLIDAARGCLVPIALFVLMALGASWAGADERTIWLWWLGFFVAWGMLWKG